MFKKIILKKIIIAIDGHSACGKSTLAKALGKALDYKYISTGDMYRAVTLYFLKNSIDINNEKKVKNALAKINIEFQLKDGQNHLILNGEDIQSQLQNHDVADHVSPVSAIPSVREKLVASQRIIGKKKGIILDGRDIGTVVFPEAELKIFLTANANERAKRRYLELKNKGQKVTLTSILSNVEKRDLIDSTREHSPLMQAHDAVVIDNTNLTPDEQLAMVVALVKARIK